MYTNIIKLARLLRGLTNVNTIADTDQFFLSTGLGKPRTTTWGTVKGSLPTGAVFAHCAFDGANSGTLIAGMNVASVTRTAKGKFDITFTTPHSTGNYTTIATAGNDDYSGTGASPRCVSVVGHTATTVSIVVERSDDAVNEDNGYINVLVLG